VDTPPRSAIYGFDLPDACASAAEIARRGPLPAEVVGLIEVHRGLKAAKTFG
jgi:hypothetical protein